MNPAAVIAGALVETTQPSRSKCPSISAPTFRWTTEAQMQTRSLNYLVA
jgi:hypothetical protein